MQTCEMPMADLTTILKVRMVGLIEPERHFARLHPMRPTVLVIAIRQAVIAPSMVIAAPLIKPAAGPAR